MSKLRVGVVFGGKSAEHEVSLQSAKNIVEAMDKSRFDVVLFGVDKQGQWHVHDIHDYLLNANNQIIAHGEGYQNRSDCLHVIELVKQSYSAPIRE